MISEVLRGISIVKFYGWETRFLNRIQGVRAEEIKGLRGEYL